MANSILLAFLSGAAQAVPNPMADKPIKKIDKKTFDAAQEALKKLSLKFDKAQSKPEIKNIFGGFAPDLHVDLDLEAAFEAEFGVSVQDWINGAVVVEDSDGSLYAFLPSTSEDGSVMH